MKTPDNIACFSAACAAVLAELHGAFPRPLDFNVVDLQEALVSARQLPAACAWTDEERASNLLSATLDYLLAEGVMRCAEGPYPPLYIGCVLSARGFSILQSPATLTGAKPGETLGSVMKKTGVMTGSAAIGQAVAMFFKLITP